MTTEPRDTSATAAQLAKILAPVRYVFFGFNGIICDLFGNHRAALAAKTLRAVLRDQDVDLPEAILSENDPLAVLRYAATLERPAVLRKAEDALCAEELAAAQVAEPVPDAIEALVAVRWSGRQPAIVSSVSAGAISSYLIAKRVFPIVKPIVGRGYGDPSIMKPHPMPILWAMHLLKAKPDECILIGHTPTDIEAANAASVPIIYRNDQSDRDPSISRRDEATADLKISTYRELL